MAQNVAAIIGLALAVSTFIFGVYQYSIAQRWKRSEYAARQLELLASDPENAFCCMALDYSTRKVPVPEKFAIFTTEKFFVHDSQLMVQGVQPEAVADTFEFPLIIYRDAFDHFFGYLEQINHDLGVGLYTLSDVRGLEYWLDQLAHPRFVRAEDREAFVSFAQAYNYSGVLELMRRFDIAVPARRSGAA